MKRLIYEVSIIRPLVIALLVVYHCLCTWCGAWPEFSCFTPSRGYFWLSEFISGFRIETIALIAGYVFAYQCVDLNRIYKFVPFAKKKLKRLYLPCLFFGTIYYFVFYYDGVFDFLSFLKSITSGAGHLWFLPMLFWCFITMWVINKYKPNKIVTFAVLSLISMMPIPFFIPFGIQRAFHFVFYFYAGYILWIHKDIIIKRMGKVEYIVLLLILYIGLVFSKEFLVIDKVSFFDKLFALGVDNLWKYFTTITGIMALYLVTCKIVYKPNFHCPEFIIHLSSVCYGVYIFHQFIIKWLYYYTDLPCILGLWLPWVVCVITLFVSYTLTLICLKSRFGRFLIG